MDINKIIIKTTLIRIKPPFGKTNLKEININSLIAIHQTRNKWNHKNINQVIHSKATIYLFLN